jgi:hypothetical protein
MVEWNDSVQFCAPLTVPSSRISNGEAPVCADEGLSLSAMWMAVSMRTDHKAQLSADLFE